MFVKYSMVLALCKVFYYVGNYIFFIKLLIMNGECSSHCSNGVCEMSAIQLSWKRVNVGGNLPPRDGHCACSCGGKIFIFGGVVQTSVGGEHRESNDLLMFDPGK